MEKKKKKTSISRYHGSYSGPQVKKYSKSKQERKYKIVIINLSSNSISFRLRKAKITIMLYLASTLIK